MQERPKMPRSQIVYGEVIYWLTITAAIVSMIGPVIALMNVDNNVLNPHYLFSAIFEGKDAQSLWQELAGGFPGGHFYLDYFSFGDGFTQFGMVLGCGVAFPALIAAAIAYFTERTYGYALLCLWVSFMILFSMLGIIKGH